MRSKFKGSLASGPWDDLVMDQNVSEVVLDQQVPTCGSGLLEKKENLSKPDSSVTQNDMNILHFSLWILTHPHGSKTLKILLNRHFSMCLSLPSGGPSVSAAKRSVSCPLPPSACSRLGRWRRQQGQLRHGHRSVCVCTPLLACLFICYDICDLALTFLCFSPQGKREDSSNQATWWLWWQAGSQGPVTLTLWGQSTSSNNLTLLDSKSALACWPTSVEALFKASPINVMKSWEPPP